MTYTKLGFSQGQVLTADAMNHIETGISEAHKATENKQDKLVSGTNIKTINGQSLLGSGNITVEGGDVTIDGSALGAKYAGLYGKKISFIGDSITTFKGYIPDGYATFFPKSGVSNVDQTWWKQVIDTTGMTLLSNASWSGSGVASVKSNGVSNSTTSAIMGASNLRVADVSKNGVHPDIIIILMGINDFYAKTPLGSWNGGDLPSEGTINTFSDAYALLVSKVLKAYPNAEVYCCTILDNASNCDPVNTGTFPAEFANNGQSTILPQYNECIRNVAHAMGANVLDMHACGIHYFNVGSFTLDGVHPNANGMKLMARKALAELSAKSIYMHSLGVASEPSVTYYTVTYKYVDVDGNTVKPSTTSSVASGTTITVSTSDAPEVEGYSISSISPTNVTVTGNTTIVFTYESTASVYYTVTYKYVDASGNTVKADTTSRVVEGTTLNLSTSGAPSVSGYTVKSVEPSGSVTVNNDTTVTYAYEAIPKHTVTYNYVDESGSAVKDSTSEQVYEGTSLNLFVANAPSIFMYEALSVSPSGSVTVTRDMNVTYTYKALQELWYVDATSNHGTNFSGVNLTRGSYAYTNASTVASYVGKPINAFRCVVLADGVVTYGKKSNSGFEALGTVTLSGQGGESAAPQVFKLGKEITLNTGEVLWVINSDKSDTGRWYYSKGTTNTYEFNIDFTASSNGTTSAKYNLGIDIGYVVE